MEPQRVMFILYNGIFCLLHRNFICPDKSYGKKQVVRIVLNSPSLYLMTAAFTFFGETLSQSMGLAFDFLQRVKGKMSLCFKLVMSFTRRFSQAEVENDDEEQRKSSKKGRRKPAYAGGLVLEPKKGMFCLGTDYYFFDGGRGG